LTLRWTTQSILVIAISLAANRVRADEPTSRPATGAAASQPAIDPELDKILTQLERRGDTVNDLACNVRQEMQGLTVGELVVKQGELKYLRGQKGGPNPRFYIHFAKITQDDFALKPEWYVFDGRWFIEAREATKNVIRREIVREGEPLDLFSVEDSPFPLPFGQKKAEILKYFDVRIVPSAPKDPPNTKHLKCIPKPGTEKAREYKEVHFYIDPGLDLPIKIVAHRKTGEKVSEIHTVTFPGLSNKSINRGLSGSDFDFKPPPGWSVSEDTLPKDVDVAKPGESW
jgi:hypothetical protein